MKIDPKVLLEQLGVDIKTLEKSFKTQFVVLPCQLNDCSIYAKFMAGEIPETVTPDRETLFVFFLTRPKSGRLKFLVATSRSDVVLKKLAGFGILPELLWGRSLSNTGDVQYFFIEFHKRLATYLKIFPEKSRATFFLRHGRDLWPGEPQEGFSAPFFRPTETDDGKIVVAGNPFYRLTFDHYFTARFRAHLKKGFRLFFITYEQRIKTQDGTYNGTYQKTLVMTGVTPEWLSLFTREEFFQRIVSAHLLDRGQWPCAEPNLMLLRRLRTIETFFKKLLPQDCVKKIVELGAQTPFRIVQKNGQLYYVYGKSWNPNHESRGGLSTCGGKRIIAKDNSEASYHKFVEIIMNAKTTQEIRVKRTISKNKRSNSLKKRSKERV